MEQYGIAGSPMLGFVWQLIVAAIYVAAGLYFLTHLPLGLWTLTLYLAVVLLVEAVSEIVGYFGVGREGGSGWRLVRLTRVDVERGYIDFTV